MESKLISKCVTVIIVLAIVLAASDTLAETENENEAQPVEVVYGSFVDYKGEAYALALDVFYPEGWDATDQRPAIICFFGGGWRNGDRVQFHPHCRDLAEQGMVAISADYRVQSRHGTSPIACVEDGRSAIRYLRENAAELGIDPARIVAAGGSAGGHVAVAAALCNEVNVATDDLDVSAVPNALVLFNPVLDTSRETGYGGNRMGVDSLRLSPVHRVAEGQPPSIVFHGDADRTVPIESARRFAEASDRVGARCELVEYAGQGHGFFNHPDFRARNDPAIYDDTLARTVAFLRDMELLDPAVQEAADE